MDADTVHVEIAVYDLLPPGRLSTVAYYAGVGLYHTSVRISEMAVEYAYGGVAPSTSSHLSISQRRRMAAKSGVFSLPSPDNGRRVERYMPGCRFLQRIPMGCALLHSTPSSTLHDKHLPSVPRRTPRKLKRSQSGGSVSHLPLLSSSASTAHLASAYQDDDLSPTHFLDDIDTQPKGLECLDEWGRYSRAGNSSNTTADANASLQNVMLPRQTLLERVVALIDSMKEEPEWRAVRYNLLTHNCNDFTAELVRRLTGKTAPGWLNRAAWVGQSLPCLVPEGWLDPPTSDEDAREVFDMPDDAGGRHLKSEAGGKTKIEQSQRPVTPLIAVPYVSTKPMGPIEVGYERVGHRT